MRKSYQQFAIVTGDTAQQLTDRLNEKLIELSEKKAFRDSMACETLFEKINSGEVRLCLPEQE